MSLSGRALLCLLLVCALGLAWGVSIGAVESAFSSEDRKRLVEVLRDSQKKDGTWGSLEDTYEGVSALTSLKSEVKHKDELCKYAASSLRDAKTVETIFYGVHIAEMLQCASALSAHNVALLNEAAAAADLHANYFALGAVFTANLNKHVPDEFDRTVLKTTVKRIADLAGAEGRFTRGTGGQESSYNSALAFQATAFAATLTDIDKAVINEIAEEVANLLEAERLADRGSGALAFEDKTGKESSLETTAEVIEGIDALQRLTGKPLGVTGEHLSDLAQFLVRLDDDVSEPEAINALITGLNFLSESPVHKPIALEILDESLSLAAKDSLRVRVTDLFGVPLGKGVRVVLVQARSRTEQSPVANQALTETADGEFVYEFLASKPEPGQYGLEFRVSQEGRATGVETTYRLVRIVASANVADATLSVSDSKNPDDPTADVRKYSLETGKKLAEVIKASPGAHLHLFFRLKNAASARAADASQVSVRLVNAKNAELDEVFDGVQTTKGYRVHVDVSGAAAKELHSASGLYRAELLLGDANLAAPLQWHFADVQLTFPAANATGSDDELMLRPRKEIRHQFRPPASRGSEPLSRLFTLLVLAPWAVLVLGLLLLGANLSRFPLSGLEPLNALVFVASLGGIFYLMYVYWLRLNMFEALYYLGLLALPAIFFGSRALRHLHVVGHKQKRD